MAITVGATGRRRGAGRGVPPEFREAVHARLKEAGFGEAQIPVMLGLHALQSPKEIARAQKYRGASTVNQYLSRDVYPLLKLVWPELGEECSHSAVALYVESIVQAVAAGRGGGPVQPVSSQLTVPIADFLRALYGGFASEAGAESVIRQGQAYPVAWFPNTALFADATDAPGLDSVLPLRAVVSPGGAVEWMDALPGRWPVADAAPRRMNFAYAQSELVEPAKRIPTDLWEVASSRGLNLCMREVRVIDGAPVITRAALARYGAIIDTSDQMLYEIANAFKVKPTCDPTLGAALLSRDSPLPQRAALYRAESEALRKKLPFNPLIRAEERACGIGVAATVLYRDSTGWRALLTKRSRKVGTYQHAFHVVPAGMLGWRFGSVVDPSTAGQIFADDYEADYVEKAMYKELDEELFGGDEGESPSDAVYALQHVAALRNRFGARAYYTGLAVDLTNERVEICCAIVVDDPDWVAEEGQFWKLNWEYEEEGKPVRGLPVWTHGDGFNEVPAGSVLQAPETVAAGAASFWAAFDLLKLLHPDGARAAAARA